MEKATTLYQVYNLVGQVIVDTMREILLNYRPHPLKADSELLKSFSFDISFQERDLKTGRFKPLQLDLFANDYAQWLDKGRRPGTRRVPISALIKFIKRRQLQQKIKGKCVRFMSVNQLAFMIQNRINRKGICGRNFLVPALEEGQRVMQLYIDRDLLDIMAKDIFEFYNTGNN